MENKQIKSFLVAVKPSWNEKTDGSLIKVSMRHCPVKGAEYILYLWQCFFMFFGALGKDLKFTTKCNLYIFNIWGATAAVYRFSKGHILTILYWVTLTNFKFVI